MLGSLQAQVSLSIETIITEIEEIGTQIDIMVVGGPKGGRLTVDFIEEEEGEEPHSLLEARRTLEVDKMEPSLPEPSRNR